MRLDKVRLLLSRLVDGQHVDDAPIEADESLTESERELGRLVLPLLKSRRSLEKELGEVAGKARALEAALDQMPVPALVLGPGGKLLASNRGAVDLLHGPGVPYPLLREAWGACSAREPGERRVALAGVGKGPLELRVVPMIRESGPGPDAWVVLLLRVGAVWAFDRAGLAKLHSLTPKEAEVVEFVALGLTNKEIGDRLDVAPETIRTHISSALLKTGARNRAGLVSVAFAALLGLTAGE